MITYNDINDYYKNSGYIKDIKKINNKEDYSLFYIFFARHENTHFAYLKNKTGTREIYYNEKIFNNLINRFTSWLLDKEINDDKIYIMLDNYLYEYIKIEKNRDQINLEDIYFIFKKFKEFTNYDFGIYSKIDILISDGCEYIEGKKFDTCYYTYDDDYYMEKMDLRQMGILPGNIYECGDSHPEDEKYIKKYLGKYYYYKAYTTNLTLALKIIHNKNRL